LFARQRGVESLWGLLLAFYPGLLAARGGLLCASRHRWGPAALRLSLAVLARETTALLAAVLLVAGLLARLTPTCWHPARPRLISREHGAGAAIAGGIPLAGGLSWQFSLVVRLGHPGLLAAGSKNSGVPLAGLIEGFVAWSVHWAPLAQVLHYADLGYLLALAEIARRLLWPGQRLAMGYLGLAWGLYGALMLTLTVYIWDGYWTFLRAASEFAMLCLLLLNLRALRRLCWLVRAATLTVWAVTAVAMAPVVAPLSSRWPEAGTSSMRLPAPTARKRVMPGTQQSAGPAADV
jgi:hypothetical protein